MAEPINLNNIEALDAPIVEQTKFEPDMKRWLSNIVDIINANFTSISNALTSISNAFSNLITAQSTNVGGSGVGPINVAVTGLTPSGYVVANLISSGNPVSISSVIAGTNQFSITFSADPGASAIIRYLAFSAQP